MKKNLLLIFLLLILITSCKNTNVKSDDTIVADTISETNNGQNTYGLNYNEQYKATVYGYMTLEQVADSNNISINYLKSKLGIPDYIRHEYKIEEIGKNYKFNAIDVARIVNDIKNKEIADQKKK